ncbi:MAG: FecR domain-containing protein [Planctomycetaceae bacterium]|nr:FecR domain-containing protein [Planctomycetaceae bacterium]
MLSAAELDELQAFLDRELSPESSARVAARLAVDPAWAEALVTLARETTVLSDWARVHQRAERIDVQAADNRRVVRALASARMWLGSAAALALIATGIIRWTQSTPDTAASVVARIEQVTGQAFITSLAVRSVATVGVVIESGQGLEVQGEDSSLVVRYADGTRLAIDGDAKIDEFVGGAPGTKKRVRIATGVLRADVAKQPSDRPMKLMTPSAEIVVLGTSFDLSGDDDLTHVETSEGAVRLIRKSDGQSIEVPAGFAGIAHSNTTLDAHASAPRLQSSRFTTPGYYRTTLLSPDGRTLVTSRFNSNVVQLWNTLDGSLLTTLQDPADAIVATAISHDGLRLATGASHGAITVWNLDTHQRLASFAGRTELQSLAFSRYSKTLAALSGPAQQAKSLTVIDLTTNAPHTHDQVFPGEFWAFSPAGKTLITASSRTSSVTLWDVASGVEKRVLREFPQRVICLALSPDETDLVVSDMSGRVTLWNVETGELSHTFRPLGGTVHGLAFSADGQRLAMGQRHATVRLWNVADHQPIATLTGSVAPSSTATIRPIFFSADRSTLATTESHDAGLVRLWRLPP